MADNFLETKQREYEERKQKWLSGQSKYPANKIKESRSSR